MNVEIVALGVLLLIAGASDLAGRLSVAGDRLSQCVPTESPSPQDENETPPSPKPSA